MALHTFAFKEETATDHVFECSKCGELCGFNKPGIGTPNADLSGTTPAFPVDGDHYVTPCPVED